VGEFTYLVEVIGISIIQYKLSCCLFAKAGFFWTNFRSRMWTCV